MASKATNTADVSETPDEHLDGPLLDTLGVAVKKMVARGKERGYITYDELNAALPPDEVSSEQIEDTMAMLSEMGINLVESEEGEEAQAAEEEVTPDGEASVPGNVDEEDLGRTDDPVRMYLREMGSVELLSREGEIAIAKRIEAGREMMIGGICESPMTVRAVLEWHDALVESKMLLRDIIDLDATYGSPGEGISEEELEAGPPEEKVVGTAAPAAAATAVSAAVAMPAVEGDEVELVEGAEVPEGEVAPVNGEEAEAEGEGEESGISLAAMELALMPTVIETFEAIAETYGKMHKVQEQRLNALQKGEVVTPAIEKKYDKLKTELVHLMDGVHLNNARIEQLVDHMNELNRRLMSLEGKLLRLAESCKIKRHDFLESYFGNELNPNWLEKVTERPRQGLERFRAQTCRGSQWDAGQHRRCQPGSRSADFGMAPHRLDGAEGRTGGQQGQEGNDRGQFAPGHFDRQKIHKSRFAIPRSDPGRQYRPDEGRR